MHIPVIKVDCTSLSFISCPKRILPIYIFLSCSDLNEQIISSIFSNRNYRLYHQARCFDCHSCQGMCFFFLALWFVKEIDNFLMRDTFVVSFELVNNSHC